MTLSGDLVVFGKPNRDSYESPKNLKQLCGSHRDFFHQLVQIGAGFPKHPLYGTSGFNVSKLPDENSTSQRS